MPELVLCDNCGEPAKYRGKRLCARCYQRFQAHGDFDLHTRERQTCLVLDCAEPVKAYGYCTKHWRRLQAHGDVEDRKWSRRGSDRCAVPGCGGQHRSMGLCARHYRDEQRNGHPVWRTLHRQKVHDDRPWTPDTVRDAARLAAAYRRAAGLTLPPSSTLNPEPGGAMNEHPDQPCPNCQRRVTPLVCGERIGDVVCQDLVCPECGEEFEPQEQEQGA